MRTHLPVGADLLSALAHDVVDDRFDDAELVGMAFLLLIAGYETTATLIGTILLGLAQRPELLRQVRAEPGLVPSLSCSAVTCCWCRSRRPTVVRPGSPSRTNSD